MSISKMKRLCVLAPRGSADGLVHRLMKLRCIQVEPAAADAALAHIPADDAILASEGRVARIDGALRHLYPYAVKTKGLVKPLHEVDLDRFRADGDAARAWEMIERTEKTVRRIGELDAELIRIQQALDAYRPWLNYQAPLSREETDTARLVLGTLPVLPDYERFRAEVEEYPAALTVVERDELTLFLAVAVHRTAEEPVLRLLNGQGFVRLSFAGTEGTAAQLWNAENQRLHRLEKEREDCVEALRADGQQVQQAEILFDCEQTVLRELQNRKKLGQTEQTVLLQGWVPEKACGKVEELLSGGEYAFSLEDPAEGDEPPVLLENNAFARNFEWVMGMYAYPRYGTYDPTFVMSIFYVLIFGIMFADVGYGLLTVLACFGGVALLKPREGMKRFLLMFGYCGISCIVMGVVFGGYFGDFPSALMENMFGVTIAEVALWFNPVAEPLTFLVVGLAVGAIHLIGGMAVQFYILCRRGEVFAAIFDIGSWWVLFAGIGVFALAGSTPGLIVTGAGAAMLILTQGRHEKNIVMKLLKGVYSLYNIINYMSDLLSYCRILALGLAASVIAEVFNLLAMMGGPTIFGFLMMAVVFCIGHALNLAINLLGTFVHTSRLQYIEFFGKFFEDGGQKFEPMEPSGKYTLNR